MKAKLIIDNKEVEIEISEEEIRRMIVPQTGYERVVEGKNYYYVDCEDVIDCVSEDNLDSDQASYDCANYYSDKIVCENNARADRLMRQLRRFAVEHNKMKTSRRTAHGFGGWVIKYDIDGLKTMLIHSTYFGDIYFDCEKTALAAIKAFEMELLWYFIDYKDSLRGVA